MRIQYNVTYEDIPGDELVFNPRKLMVFQHLVFNNCMFISKSCEHDALVIARTRCSGPVIIETYFLLNSL